MPEQEPSDGTTTFSVRFFDEVLEQLDSHVTNKDRSRNYLIQDAVCQAIGLNLKFIAQRRRELRKSRIREVQ